MSASTLTGTACRKEGVSTVHHITALVTGELCGLEGGVAEAVPDGFARGSRPVHRVGGMILHVISGGG